jgi:TfoX/Sxy family transcriptional regulator of competence genes
MAYDEGLADELRDQLEATGAGITEKKMFGGLAFMVEGNFTVAASRNGGLLVRTDPDGVEELLELPGVEQMESAGRKMPGWVYVDAGAIDGEESVAKWLDRALEFVTGLPPK